MKLDKIIFNQTKKDVKKENDQIWSLNIQDYLKYNNIKIEKQFL